MVFSVERRLYIKRGSIPIPYNQYPTRVALIAHRECKRGPLSINGVSCSFLVENGVYTEGSPFCFSNNKKSPLDKSRKRPSQKPI
jgi:hypothetical protein